MKKYEVTFTENGILEVYRLGFEFLEDAVEYCEEVVKENKNITGYNLKEEVRK